jgi:hypothetical protein
MRRLESVWGEDADVWKPERFLEKSEDGQKIRLGMIGNLYELYLCQVDRN